MKMHLLPRPKTYRDAETEFMRSMGDPRTMNKYLCVALVVVSCLAGGLLWSNSQIAAQQRERVVVRIDDVGRAQAVGVTTAGYKAQPNEVKYFLSEFVHDYYSRNRSTLRDDFARSMMFLDASLANARMQGERKDKALEKFIVSGDDEIAIQVNNIVLGDLTQAPYSAQVDMEKVYSARNGGESRREKCVAGVTFTLANEVSNSAVTVNPLGFTVLSLRLDEAF